MGRLKLRVIETLILSSMSRETPTTGNLPKKRDRLLFRSRIMIAPAMRPTSPPTAPVRIA